MIPSIGQTPIRLLFLAVAVCGVLLLLFNGVSPVEARVKTRLRPRPRQRRRRRHLGQRRNVLGGQRRQRR